MKKILLFLLLFIFKKETYSVIISGFGEEQRHVILITPENKQKIFDQWTYSGSIELDPSNYDEGLYEFVSAPPGQDYTPDFLAYIHPKLPEGISTIKICNNSIRVDTFKSNPSLHIYLVNKYMEKEKNYIVYHIIYSHERGLFRNLENKDYILYIKEKDLILKIPVKIHNITNIKLKIQSPFITKKEEITEKIFKKIFKIRKLPPYKKMNEYIQKFRALNIPTFQTLLSKILKKSPFSLFEDKDYTSPIIYDYDDGIVTIISTKAVYYPKLPVIKSIRPIDFDISVSTTFGCRNYIINGQTSSIQKEFGHDHIGEIYPTVFYGSAYDLEKRIFVNAPITNSNFFIDFYDMDSFELIHRIEGYQANSLKFFNNFLYFLGNDEKNIHDWKHQALWCIDLETYKVTKLTNGIFADPRGLEFHKKNKKVYISECFGKHAIYELDIANFQIERYFTGFYFPNRISITQQGTLLVADEHHDVIQEIDLNNEKILRSTPFDQLTSPGSAFEISQGQFKGYWLVADTDHNRVLVVNPDNFKDIIFEVSNVRSPVEAIPLYH